MIKSIQINNFQSHKDSYLEFDKGVNIIIGTSDSGKTAVIRALRWLIQNRPLGNSFRSDWGGETKVILNTLEGNIIERVVDNNKNLYISNKKDLTAFGTDVPEEIINLLNINDINLQQQFDKSFLITSTPGEVAGHFNKLTNLDQIDKGNKKLSSSIREKENIIKAKRQQREQYIEEIEGFDYLETFEMDMEDLEEQEKQFIEKVKKTSNLKTLVYNIQEIENKINSLEKLTVLEHLLIEVFDLKRDYGNKIINYNTLVTFINDFDEIDSEIVYHNKLGELEKPVQKIIELKEEYKIQITKEESLYTLLQSIDEIKGHIEKKEKKLKTLQEEYENVLPDICPLCNQKIPHNHEKNK